MKWNRGNWLLCALTTLSLLTAIFLPPQLSVWGDAALTGTAHAEDISTAGGGFIYKMTTAERIGLFASTLDFNNDTYEDLEAQPNGGNISAAQVSTICREEFSALHSLGVSPIPDEMITEISSYYYTILDLKNPQQVLSIWQVVLSLSGNPKTGDNVTVTLDAETGLVYSFLCASTFMIEDPVALAEAWGSYLSIGAPINADQISAVWSDFPPISPELEPEHARKSQFSTFEVSLDYIIDGEPLSFSLCVTATDSGRYFINLVPTPQNSDSGYIYDADPTST